MVRIYMTGPAETVLERRSFKKSVWDKASLIAANGLLNAPNYCVCLVAERTRRTSMADTMETKLKNGPDDGISSVVFSPGSSQFLLVSSWDSSVRLYDVISNSQRLKYTHERAVLDICFQVIMWWSDANWNFNNELVVSINLRMLFARSVEVLTAFSRCVTSTVKQVHGIWYFIMTFISHTILF